MPPHPYVGSCCRALLFKRALLLKHASAIQFNCWELHQRRYQSSRRREGDSSFKADGLPFTVSPEEATKKFYKWANDEQGLRWILNRNSVQLSASYCPVWSFDMNVRYVVTDSYGNRRFDWKPDIFQAAYGNQSVVYLPGLSSYAGYSYRRSLLNPLHNISLVFLGNQTIPFGQWMLRDMKMVNDQMLGIFLDPWNSPKSRALAVVKEELVALASESPYSKTDVQTEVVASRRVLMPTFVFEYKVLGAEYTAFVSGCDAGVGVSGDSHKVFKSTNLSPSSSFLNQAFGNAQVAARVLGPRGLMAGIQLLFALAGRILVRIPIIATVATLFVGFRKVVQPFFKKRAAAAAWERQREHEALMDESIPLADTLKDNGAARAYFQQNRARILSRLSTADEHTRGNFDWYETWEAWAREQYQKQQQQQGGFAQGRQTKQQETYKKASRPKQEYQWDFDANDPYSVLGITHAATKTQISAAYRKLMMEHHPDLQAGRSEAEKQRAIERTKLINEAYRILKSRITK
ncbi:hypothetical protein MPSEU_000427800 [Mayamaea pseudoterrestris]|nr:hypothetical protein MPSEU_000427800 [Mayamaea pseudoterrestris]